MAQVGSTDIDVEAQVLQYISNATLKISFEGDLIEATMGCDQASEINEISRKALKRFKAYHGWGRLLGSRSAPMVGEEITLYIASYGFTVSAGHFKFRIAAADDSKQDVIFGRSACQHLSQIWTGDTHRSCINILMRVRFTRALDQVDEAVIVPDEDQSEWLNTVKSALRERIGEHARVTAAPPICAGN